MNMGNSELVQYGKYDIISSHSSSSNNIENAPNDDEADDDHHHKLIIKGNDNNNSSNNGGGGKCARYSAEQVQVLERLYCECPSPSLAQRQQLIGDCSLLHGLHPKQIKVWFQNRRCREKQRKEWTRLQGLNGRLTAMNTLLMEENAQLQHHVAHLLHHNHLLRLHLPHPPPPPADQD